MAVRLSRSRFYNGIVLPILVIILCSMAATPPPPDAAPREEPAAAESPSPPGDDTGATLVHVETADGARLAIRRRANPGGPPVILVHGVASNAYHWDLPAVDTPVGPFRSLASLLDDAGFDLWMVNLRGYGGPNMRSTPPEGQEDWCVDHFILYDLPAVVEQVRSETGRPPFIIAASMGAMVLAGYMQGATLVEGESGPRIIADAQLARQRAAEIAGCVFAEFPAALRWPRALYNDADRLDANCLMRYWSTTDASSNFHFEFLARLRWLEAVLLAIGEVPLDRLRLKPESAWLDHLPPKLAESLRAARKAVMGQVVQLAGRFTGAQGLQVDVEMQRRGLSLDHMKAGVLKQLGRSVRAGGFISVLGAPEHVYSAHYNRIVAPLMVVAGGCDRIANAEVTREVFFDRVGSEDKTWLFFENVGHAEFDAAPFATREVYPQIVAWFRQRLPH